MYKHCIGALFILFAQDEDQFEDGPPPTMVARPSSKQGGGGRRRTISETPNFPAKSLLSNRRTSGAGIRKNYSTPGLGRLAKITGYDRYVQV